MNENRIPRISTSCALDGLRPETTRIQEAPIKESFLVALDRLDTLSRQVEELRARLTPVMSPSSPCGSGVSGGADCAAPAMSEMREGVEEFTRRIDSVSSQIVEFLNRLEV